tara:strand:- start:1514 stop:2506 length:993 start_codon:yes stop_codon:yes gene_type:complete
MEQKNVDSEQVRRNLAEKYGIEISDRSWHRMIEMNQGDKKRVLPGTDIKAGHVYAAIKRVMQGDPIRTAAAAAPADAPTSEKTIFELLLTTPDEFVLAWNDTSLTENEVAEMFSMDRAQLALAVGQAHVPWRKPAALSPPAIMEIEPVRPRRKSPTNASANRVIAALEARGVTSESLAMLYRSERVKDCFKKLGISQQQLYAAIDGWGIQRRGVGAGSSSLIDAPTGFDVFNSHRVGGEPVVPDAPDAVDPAPQPVAKARATGWTVEEVRIDARLRETLAEVLARIDALNEERDCIPAEIHILAEREKQITARIDKLLAGAEAIESLMAE